MAPRPRPPGRRAARRRRRPRRRPRGARARFLDARRRGAPPARARAGVRRRRRGRRVVLMSSPSLTARDVARIRGRRRCLSGDVVRAGHGLPTSTARAGSASRVCWRRRRISSRRSARTRTRRRAAAARGGDDDFGIDFSPRVADADADFAGAVTLLSTDSFARDTPAGTPRAAAPRDAGTDGAPARRVRPSCAAPRAPPSRRRRRGAGRAAVAAPVLPLSQRAGSGVHHEPARGPVLADVDRRHAPGRAAAARARARCPATGISAAAAEVPVAHPHTSWRPDGTGAAATNPRCLARPALRPVWSRTARIPACGLRCGTAGARQSPSSGDGSLGKGI